MEDIGKLIPSVCKVEAGRLKIYTAGADASAAKLVARNWYKSQTAAKADLYSRKYCKQLAVQPGKLIVAEQASRWGSCSKNSDIRLNWRLSMMPPAIIEYVVVHELCHIKIKSHSPRFWSLLKSVLPDYEKRRQWLRLNGPGVLLSGTWG